jgi:hypothetical protein
LIKNWKGKRYMELDTFQKAFRIRTESERLQRILKFLSTMMELKHDDSKIILSLNDHEEEYIYYMEAVELLHKWAQEQIKDMHNEFSKL